MRALLVAVAGAAALAAAPAYAGTAVVDHPYNSGVAWGKTAITTSDGDDGPVERVLTLTVTAQNGGDPTSTTTTSTGFQCTAVSGPTAIGTGLLDCYARGLYSGEIYRSPTTGMKPGLLDTRASVGLKLPMEPVEVCARARARYADGVLMDTPFVCAK